MRREHELIDFDNLTLEQVKWLYNYKHTLYKQSVTKSPCGRTMVDEMRKNMEIQLSLIDFLELIERGYIVQVDTSTGMSWNEWEESLKKHSTRITREKDSFETGVLTTKLYENAETIEQIVDTRNIPDIFYISFTLDGERYYVEKSMTKEKVWNTLVKLGGIENE